METYDYVIVGGGTAGSLLANRLSADGRCSVCVLEAGPADRNPYIRIPAGFTKTLFDPSLTWQFETEPFNRTRNRRMLISQGRTLGGSSAINGMVVNRGAASDYDAWAAMGNRGWSYHDVLPYFKRIERRVGPGNDAYRGRTGLLPVTTPSWSHPLVEATFAAAQHNGIARNADNNGEHFGGAGRYQVSIERGRRVSAAHAFLEPARRMATVTVKTDAFVQRLVFEGKRAVGVDYSSFRPRDRPDSRVMARKSVIVSAGTFNSAKLLQLSGIGAADELSKVGIPVIHALEGVGRNLQDHFGTRMTVRLKGTDSINTMVKGLGLPWEVLKWLAGRPSVVGLGPALVHVYGKSAPGLTVPDYVLLCTPACFKPDFSGAEDFPGMTIGAYPIRPASTGHVRISSPDPRVAPSIQPNYLDRSADCRVALAAGRAARALFTAPSLAKYFDMELRPGRDVQSDDEWIDWLRENGTSSCHWVGTCKMGPAQDSMAVVDDRLRVHGLDGLRVVDASVMPRLTSTNTCMPTLMIAEKAAEMIIEDLRDCAAVRIDKQLTRT